jgi:hypothetical protein
MVLFLESLLVSRVVDSKFTRWRDVTQTSQTGGIFKPFFTTGIQYTSRVILQALDDPLSAAAHPAREAGGGEGMLHPHHRSSGERMPVQMKQCSRVVMLCQLGCVPVVFSSSTFA